jgi:hypothetical protein
MVNIQKIVWTVIILSLIGLLSENVIFLACWISSLSFPCLRFVSGENHLLTKNKIFKWINTFVGFRNYWF